MKNSKLICTVCGVEYEGCLTCQKAHTYAPWRNIVDTVDHYKAFCIARDWYAKEITDAEAKEKLKSVDVTGYEKWNTATGEAMRTILKEEKQVEIEKINTNIKKHVKIKGKTRV